MKINLKVRLKNRAFWITFIPAVLVVIVRVLAIFGITWDASTLSNELVNIVEAVFVLLAILGVVNDPTTATFSDSEQAMMYEKPKE